MAAEEGGARVAGEEWRRVEYERHISDVVWRRPAVPKQRRDATVRVPFLLTRVLSPPRPPKASPYLGM